MMREGADTWPRAIYDVNAENMERQNLKEQGWKKQPSIFMPRPLSRITLEISDVCVERLQEISEEDAMAEGVGKAFEGRTREGRALIETSSHRAGFQLGWNTLNAKRGFGWNKNPWVWVISFRRIRPRRGTGS